MCPRYANGTFSCPQLPDLPYPLAHDYIEGDAWQWAWFVPHDMKGLVSLFPSAQDFVQRLNEFHNKSGEWAFGNSLPNPYYWPGNEPDILTPWQYVSAGEVFANYTQYWVRNFLHTAFDATPGGIPGNDDFGTMSAWLVWSYLGLYPITGTEMYILSSPVFANTTVTLMNGSATPSYLSIVSYGSCEQCIFIQKISLNGQQLTQSIVAHSELLSRPHSVLEYWLDTTPCSSLDCAA